jgi:hypothetical protein
VTNLDGKAFLLEAILVGCETAYNFGLCQHELAYYSRCGTNSVIPVGLARPDPRRSHQNHEDYRPPGPAETLACTHRTRGVECEFTKLLDDIF